MRHLIERLAITLLALAPACRPMRRLRTAWIAYRLKQEGHP